MKLIRKRVFKYTIKQYFKVKKNPTKSDTSKIRQPRAMENLKDFLEQNQLDCLFTLLNGKLFYTFQFQISLLETR